MPRSVEVRKRITWDMVAGDQVQATVKINGKTVIVVPSSAGQTPPSVDIGTADVRDCAPQPGAVEDCIVVALDNGYVAFPVVNSLGAFSCAGVVRY